MAKANGYIKVHGAEYTTIKSIVVYSDDADMVATPVLSASANVVNVIPGGSADDDAVITSYYTTNGDDPTANSTPVENYQIVLSPGTSTVKVISYNATTSTASSVESIEVVVPSSISTTITTYGYASFSSNYALDFTSVNNAEAYIATSKNGNSIRTQKVTGTVAAGTGLILKSTNGGAADVTIPVTSETGTYYNTQTDPVNYLFAINSDYDLIKADEGTNYVLSVQTIDETEKVVFAPIGETTSAPVKAGQAGLWLPASSGEAYALTLFFSEDVTGINTVKTNNPQAGKVYYNLQGQRVSEPKQGIYVVEGKKVLVK